jgi:transposase
VDSSFPKDEVSTKRGQLHIETAKANGLEPYAYLRHLFTELPKAQTLEQIEALLPFHAKTQQLTPTPPEQ